MTIKLINDFLKERQPNKKIQLAHTIKEYSKDLYSNIMMQNSILLNNKKYIYIWYENKYKRV